MPVGEGRSKLESDRCIQGLESITYEAKTFWYVMAYVIYTMRQTQEFTKIKAVTFLVNLVSVTL